MPDFLTILQRWWKVILSITAAVAILAALLVSFRPKQYLATVTALPANGVFTDKARIFNDQVNQLYSALGAPDELDPVIGTSVLDTLYLAVAAEHQLAGYYKIPNDSKDPLYEAAMTLKGNTSVSRSEHGSLKIKVWDGSPQMAATLANSYFNKLQALHQQVYNKSNLLVLQRLQENYLSLASQVKGTDSTNARIAMNSAGQLEDFAHLINEYRIQVATNPESLLLVEAARAPLRHDKPKPLPVILMAIFAAFVFSLLLAVFLESRQSR